ncbi:interferon-induced protein with tetratricopeptide repeats 1-like [Vidua chalybeata]|uniref:interferon-induced protein with tetratricopeptide repeats 1-like n=1 Tax=Vidua chalybeata TaxID=81927 RepID=UPI0023A89573|nr:interferon-induced protein with tetratricopeptide repeats 1-like [Vidua chalybeata]XP_053823550.1 interferon-induced protein with tetratricopeptide repeats 1-like [Vidua chalybeata]XP_053823551.1 interferon-induced protein with tetratricopeptide repeats 1-like [Vidua chalybeata]
MLPAAKLSKEQLKDKLDALQCHFTWMLGVESCSPLHLLQKLDVEIKHTAHQNQLALLGLQAYLHQLNNQSKEALQSLRAAEEHKEEEQLASTAGSLITYGNYAWIHYLQGSYQEAETCLEQVQQLCPTPWDVRLIPHIQAQKGWSLLALRARNGERARECFNVALMIEPQNRSFRTGLAMAFYSSWNFSWQPDVEREVRNQLERIVDEQPNNYRAKIYLARLLEEVDREKSIGLAEECAEKSSDPEVLKLSALFWMPQSTERALEIIQRALQQDPGYHLLYQALANCYKQQWVKAKEEDKDKIRCKAIKDLQKIVQTHPDLDLTLAKLQLAEFIGAKNSAQEKEIYMELQGKINTLSLRCRQALSLSWGKYFLYRERSQKKAKAKFMECYNIPLQTDHRRDCGRRLVKMAHIYQSKGDTDTASAIHRFLQEADRHCPRNLLH